jgi:hypothetical protein
MDASRTTGTGGKAPDQARKAAVTRRRLLGAAATAAAGGALLATPAGAPAASGTGACATPTPAGFRKLLVYIAEGPASAGSIRDVDTVLAFQHDVMGRDAAAVAAYIEEAKAFYLRRFGLDFFGVEAPTPIGPWQIDGAVLQGGFLSPERGYTAHVVSEERVGPEGWMVRDGSFGVGFTKDLVLHGSWGGAAGKLAPAGSSVTFGDYNIKVERPGGRRRQDPIMIHFESGSPIVGDADGTRHFVCDLSHAEWGPGHARGTVLAEGGIRNVLTFPPDLP